MTRVIAGENKSSFPVRRSGKKASPDRVCENITEERSADGVEHRTKARNKNNKHRLPECTNPIQNISPIQTITTDRWAAREDAQENVNSPKDVSR